MADFVKSEAKKFEWIFDEIKNMDYYLMDNFNTTWHKINNPPVVVHVRKNETLVLNVTVDKT